MTTRDRSLLSSNYVGFPSRNSSHQDETTRWKREQKKNATNTTLGQWKACPLSGGMRYSTVVVTDVVVPLPLVESIHLMAVLSVAVHTVWSLYKFGRLSLRTETAQKRRPAVNSWNARREERAHPSSTQQQLPVSVPVDT